MSTNRKFKIVDGCCRRKYRLSGAILLAFSLLGLLIAMPVHALRLKTNWAQRVNLSENIIRGQVVEVKSYWNPERTIIYTDVTIAIDEHIKGNGLNQVTITVPGGTVGNDTLWVSDTPQYKVGDYSVTLLESSGQVTGGPDGVYLLQDPKVQSDRLLSLEEDRFLSWIRAYANGETRDSFEEVSSVTYQESLSYVTISGVSPSIISAGTSSELTIIGSGFGASRGSETYPTIGFRYKDRSYMYDNSKITYWSDTQIKVDVFTQWISGYPYSPGSWADTVAFVDNRGNIESTYALSVPFGYLGRKWPEPPVPYWINVPADQPNEALDAIQVAANAWTGAQASFSFSYQGTTTSGHGRDLKNVITWANLNSDIIFAYTFAWLGDDGTPPEADIVFNTTFNWSADTPTPIVRMDIQTVALHELGHCVCLLDLYGDNDAPKVMYGYGSNGLMKRSLDLADKQGIQWIYGTSLEHISVPTLITGPINGATGMNYTYFTGGSTSNWSDSVQYLFDWDDGTNSGWLPVGTTSASHSWSSIGTYRVKANARCAAHTDAVSSWSSTLLVNINSATVLVTTETSPSGLQAIVDGISYAAPHAFNWSPGSSHTLSVASPQSGTSGTRYVYSSWSDGGQQSHTVTAPSSSTTYTAMFNTQYELTINSSSSGGVAVTPSPIGDQSGMACVASVGVVCAGYYSGGASVILTAIMDSGYTFTGWSGSLTGNQNPVTIIMNEPKNVVAIFSVAGRVINLPRTGQDKCCNSLGAEISCTGTEQDGELKMGVAWPDPRFTVNGECVSDNLTGLMWSKNGNLPNGTRNWQGALNYVASINSGSGLCGYKDWRLPNVNEFESLINAGEANSATWLVSQGFINVESVIHWTSTSLANDPSGTMVVGIWGGGTSFGPKSNLYYVWPVRSGQPGTSAPSEVWRTGQTTTYATGDDGDLKKGVAWPSPRFTDNGNGTVTDKLTGLIWTKNANLAGGTKTWQEALDYVRTLNTGGHSDWRLPNRKELFSLIDYSKHNPPLPAEATQLFQNVQFGDYWSSTTYAANTSIGWFVNMFIGYVYISSKSNSNYVWPVRSGQGTLSRNSPADFDGDGKTDITIWRPENGYWYTIRSSDQGVNQVQWGAEGDIPVPGDYDGDGKADTAVWRPSRCYWYIINSSDGSKTYTLWGAAGDIPVPGDYDGDGKTDIAIWRPSNGYWYIIRSSDQSVVYVQWGEEGDIPVSGDFDGDGKADIAVWRPSNGYWYIINSSDQSVDYVQWGTEGDIPVPGDYDGDGKTDIAVWRPSRCYWYIIRSSDGIKTYTLWGAAGDIPLTGDFDGDGKSDMVIWRPSNGYWYIIRSSDQSVDYVQWGGVLNDIPISQ